jgi:tripartite-type tricarboxylate transporter receptor subunit TctC
MAACAYGLALGCAVLATSLSSQAQTWPQRTVRVIVPNPPGVAMDIVARMFAERLATRWGQPVIVENMPGADGIIATREFVSRRDDHTLMYSFPGLITINPLVHEKLPYDPAHDLMPISATSDNSLAIAVSASLEVRSLVELAQFARSNPGKLTWAATPGVPYYAFAAFHKMAGGESVHAPYRDFGQALVDLTEGRIGAVASGIAPLLPHARAGKVRLLAIMNAERAPAAHDVPTASEAGFPDLAFSAVTGFFGGRGMPIELRDRIAAAVADIARDPAVRERLVRMGAAPYSGTAADFVAAIERQRNQIAAIMRPETPSQPAKRVE